MHEPAAHGLLDFEGPTLARLVDALLGGRDNYAADRALVEQLVAVDPGVRQLARDHRDWVVRCLRLLVTAHGIDQFIDIGSGLPTTDNTHQIAQRYNAEARVVYVDNDPVVQAYGRALLEENDLTHMAPCDFTDPSAALASVELFKNVDFERPIGLMLCSVVHHILDDDEADTVVRAWVDVLPRGSFVMLTHDIDPGGEHSALVRRLDEVLAGTPLASVHRTREQIEGYFAGLDLIEPGVSLLHAWWPDGPRVRPLTPISYTVVGALARKP
ncbi:SAM-dependent methyltransferase [Actinokineospora guangxiensis]|uniref:SAM-dependent methyltransferase n=1 Tax=Actinokineospora guangxiensis TaxID=1490288 RepID=A0ABW0EPN9_9PSEU